MKIILFTTAIINIIAILVMLTGLFHKFENPKMKALFGYSMVGSLLLLVLFLGFILIFRLIIEHDFSQIYFLCIISPFIIGKLVKFETLRIYTIIQILFLLLSFAVLVSEII